MEPILEVKHLHKNFKDFFLRDINFTLEKGFIMGFIGPNGSGKSTTIKLIMNLLRKDGGQIKLFGKDHITHEQEVKNRIGFVYEGNHFYDELTVTDMKRVIAPHYMNWDDPVFYKYVERFNLPHDKKIKDLSKGMRMKFSLAIALSHHAQLLIMDEPTSGLDPVIRYELLEIFSEFIQDENRSIFFSTHITTDLEKIADYITFIHDGKILFSQSKDDILDHYGLVKGKNELIDDDVKKMFVGIKQNRFGFEGLVINRTNAVKTFGDSVVIEKPTLEDIMVFYTRGNES